MKTHTKYWFLEVFDLFKKIGRPRMMEMCDLLEMEAIDKDSTVEIGKRDKKCVFFLKRGAVKFIDPTRTSLTLQIHRGRPSIMY